ncbi:hypothetical protein SMC6_06125 [Candidatus Cryosericum odellii]|uniref:Uncharacterized protein n=1 Tax=Candidatus Cryosericum odellii TaxID=2290917 RepID=A0A398D3D0_9BACT|nr:hypothetical protein SMC6_06125 [Candidatus Cryosericum odellii]RIE09662.1 hypothetical protein SMC5_06910 [Candidatus Cryosericum odellii]
MGVISLCSRGRRSKKLVHNGFLSFFPFPRLPLLMTWDSTFMFSVPSLDFLFVICRIKVQVILQL